MATLTTARPVRRSRLPRASADTWSTVFGIAYLVVMTNVLLAVGSLPLLVLLVTTDPRASWPALACAAVLATPALAGAFGVFRAFTTERSTDVARTFARTWWTQLRRSLTLGGLALGVAVLVVVDLQVVAGTRIGAVLTPVLLVLLALTLTTALLALVAIVERPDARLRDALKVGLYLGVRRWYLTALSFVVLALLGVLFTAHPALAVGLAATPLLYGVWGNARYTLRPVLLPDPAGPSD